MAAVCFQQYEPSTFPSSLMTVALWSFHTEQHYGKEYHVKVRSGDYLAFQDIVPLVQGNQRASKSHVIPSNKL